MKTLAGVCIKTCYDNSDYLELHEHDIFYLPLKYASKEVEEDKNNLISKIKEYRKTYKTNFKCAVRKDSILGNYIISMPSDDVYNYDEMITYEKLTNALNIAIFENNPIYLELIELFRKQIVGPKKIVAFEYGLNIVNYILKNYDFKSYLKKMNGIYEPDKYLVYENDELSLRTLLVNDKQKVHLI